MNPVFGKAALRLEEKARPRLVQVLRRKLQQSQPPQLSPLKAKTSHSLLLHLAHPACFAPLAACKKFIKVSHNSKFALLMKHRICFDCLRTDHSRPEWIGLDLFNDGTSPSGHISRPTQVNVSQSCFTSLNKFLKLNYIVQVWGLVEVSCVISDRRIPLLAGIPLCMTRELSRRGYSICQLCSIRHGIPVPLHIPGAYGQCRVFDHSGDKQSVVLGTRYGTCGLGMANSRSGDYNLFSSGQALEFLWLPQCWFHKVEISAMYSHIPLGLNQLLNVGVNQWLQICVVDTCQWVYPLVEGLFC